MFHEALLRFGPVEEYMCDSRVLQQESVEIIRDFRSSLDMSVHAGFAKT